MTRLPNPQLARQWRERFERFDQSELTVAEFCELEGYSTGSFYQWRRKLDAEEPCEPPSFIPVSLGSNDLEDRSDRRIEIELPGGATVRLAIQATPAEQRQLIAAIVQATSTGVQS